MKIGIIAAMENEAAHLKEKMTRSDTSTVAGMEFFEGTLSGVNVCVVRCGIGKVNAAVCAQILIDRFAVTHIINTGVAGSLDARINIGDIVVSTDAVHHDMNATILGCHPGQIPQLDVFKFVADEQLRTVLAAAIAEAAPEISVFEGCVASGDIFISEEKMKYWINDEFGALCCEMEGAAIAQTCYLNQVPYVIVRAISDKADGSEFEDYPVFEEKAARHCARTVEYALSKLAAE